MSEGVCRVDRFYPHPRQAVWRALTTPELLARWLMPNDFAPVVGHRFTFQTEPGPGFDGVVHCEVLAVEAPSRLAFSWRGGPLDTQVRFELTEEQGGTRLRMEHSGFRGLQARLVQRILQIGNRTLYGKRLPAVLDDINNITPPGDPACMEQEQGLWVQLLRLLPRRKR